MADQKIKVSLDEVNSTQVDAELHRQDVAQRMAEHQEKIRLNFGGSGEMLGAKGGFFRKAMVYMAIFGLVFSILGWLLGEGPIRTANSNPVIQTQELIGYIVKEKPNITTAELKTVLKRIKENTPVLSNNEYLPDKFVDMSNDERTKLLEETVAEVRGFSILWYIILGAFISIGLAIAEGVVSRNITLVLRNGFLGAILGGIGGLVVSLFIDQLYNALRGDVTTICLQQIFARAVGWGILGAFLAIAPGIMMRSAKKFFLGLAGGALGGLLGGILFDPICHIFGNSESAVAFARFVNVVGLGVGAAVATVFLENIAKQGWLKVAAGVIAGKQFILYRNPTVIGSSPKCEIYLFKDPSIAPKHAAINNRNGDFLITAIEGATVLVNNSPVRQQKLKSGDQIKIGYTTFIFEAKALKKQ